MDELLKIGLPIYYLAFFALAFFLRSYLVWKKTGINPYVFGGSDSPYDWIGYGFKLSLFLNFMAIFWYSFFPSYYEFIAPFKWLEVHVLQVTGLVFLFVSLIWIAVSQAQMGTSWRVGIDKKNDTDLVQNGLYKISRNPIFFGMRITGLGLFLAIPNAFTFATFVMGDVLMQVQVRLEEEFLFGKHGDKYEEFKNRVRRWI